MPRTRTGKSVAGKPRKKTTRRPRGTVANARDVTIIGLPLDLGAGRRGTDMGPSAMRIAGLHEQLHRMGHGWEDLGDLDVPAVETLENADPDAKFLPEIARACRQLHHRVVGALERGRFPVVLGGDHSAAVGSISGVSHHFRKRKETMGLLWVDAHGDMNTPESSPSGNVHGMPLAAMLGIGRRELTHIGGFAPKVEPGRTVLLGARDVDVRERKIIKESGIRVFTMTEIDEKGMPRVMAEALPLLTGGTAGFHVSFDVDAIDPRYAPGVGTASDGGLTYREAHLLAELCARTGRLSSIDVMEVNPVIDNGNRTGRLAMELILSFLGKRIL